MRQIDTKIEQLLLVEAHWKAGYAVSKSGELIRGQGFVAWMGRIVRVILRYVNPYSGRTLDRLILDDLEKLRVAASSDVSTRSWKKVGRIHQYADALVEKKALSERGACSSLSRIARVAEKDPLLRRIGEAAETRTTFLESIEDRDEIKELADPSSYSNGIQGVPLPSGGTVNLTDDFKKDFHRTRFVINGVEKYGTKFPKNAATKMIQELLDKGADLADIEKLLRFCHQGSLFQASTLALKTCPKEAHHPANESIFYYIDVDEKGVLSLRIRLDFQYRTADNETIGRHRTETLFQFNHLTGGRRDYDQGTLEALISKID